MNRGRREKTLTTRKIVQLLVPAGSEPRLIVFAGLPASGKSTFCDGLEEAGFVRISLDEIRKEIYGDASEIGDWKVTRKRFDELYNAALAAKKNIIIDNTNFMRSQRTRVIDMAKNAGYTDIHVAMMDVPLEECIRRNKLRDRVVKEEVIRDMHKMLHGSQFPGDDEGVVTVLAPTDVRTKYKVSGYVASAA
ncbi:MAG: ATP-binding protein [Candidatus Melainabacteria bacterium]|jgi:predicted kinase|nr:ATP-binding protein [Candidatus Melainabacteria bacterium]